MIFRSYCDSVIHQCAELLTKGRFPVLDSALNSKPPGKMTFQIEELKKLISFFGDLSEAAYLLTDSELNICWLNDEARSLLNLKQATLSNENLTQLIDLEKSHLIPSNNETLLARQNVALRAHSVKDSTVHFRCRELQLGNDRYFLYDLRDHASVVQLKNELNECNLACKKITDTVDEEKNAIREGLAQYLGKTIKPLIPAVNEHCDRGSLPDSICSRKLAHLSQLLGKSALDISQGFSNLRTVLTTTELRICTLLASDFSQKEIVEMEAVSMNTLKTHIKHIRKKLGINAQDGTLQLLLKSQNTHTMNLNKRTG